MTTLLDQPQTRSTLDPQDMLGRIERFREQCAEGEQIARAFSFPANRDMRNVVICGMGGSAIGGDLIRAYAAGSATVPIEVVRNYSLPRYVNADSLVIVCSYSGNTEESLSAYQQARERGARLLGLTTGGLLCSRFQQDGFPCLIIPTGFPPRAALGYSSISLLLLFERLGLVPDQQDALRDLYATLSQVVDQNRWEVPAERNPAKQLAQALNDTLPIIYAGQDAFQPVAIRWMGQFNENAKVLAHAGTLPEMNHNEILGWSRPDSLLKKCRPVYLMDSGYHPQTVRRFRAMTPILSQAAAGISEVQSQGQTLLARLFSLIVLGDFTSVYLAFLRGVDPTPMQAIDDLKSELKKA